MVQRIYRAAFSAYATLATICATIALLWGLAVWRADAPWGPVLLPVAAFAFGALWLSRFRITVDEQHVVVSQPFHRSQRLERREILSIEFAEQTRRSESPLTLCIRTSGGREVRLDAKVFEPLSIKELLTVGKQGRKAA